MNVDRYLGRIAYEGSRQPSAETLRALHRHHMLAVPFENLDVHHRPIVIDRDAFVRKIVDERRGGFCYELNGAFAALLQALGFEVALLSAGVARADGSYGPDYDHLTLLVTIDGAQWLADVGFGDSFVEPLHFEPDREQRDPAGTFRIGSQFDGAFVVERRQDAGWEPQYHFTLTPRSLSEFAGMCHYHQTSPKSSFTQKTVCSLATADGRITLSGQRLIVTRRGEREERELSEPEWRDELAERFGVQLPF